MACTAFRLSDLRPCRAVRRANCETCHAHRTFYNKPLWKSRFMNLNNRKYLLQGIDYEETSSIGRIQRVIEYSLKSRKIILTEEDVAAMAVLPRDTWGQPSNSLMDVLIIASGTGMIKAHWNPQLLLQVLFTYTSIYINPSLIDVRPSLEPRFGRLLMDTNPSLIFQRLFCSRYMERIYIHHPERIKDLLDAILSFPQMRSHLLLSASDVCNYFNPIFATILLPLLEAKRRAEMDILKRRVRVYKEGIAMRVYHPRNVERWLDTGGWDLIAMITGDEGLKN